ncbi:MAG: flippase [Candidatus Aenigmarchaeota archaeon]|nr:flippase [Candidatus Aenigmarchaeota archaeon]
MENQNYLKRVASSAFFVFLFSVLGAFVAYLIRFVLTSNLTPADYGLFYASLSLVGLFAVFKDFGLTQSLVYYISKFKAEKKFKKLKTSVFTVFLIQLFPALTITIIIFLSADFLAVNYLHLSGNIFKGVLVIKFLAIAYFIQIFYTIIISIFQGFQKIKLYATANFCRMLLYFTITWLFISLNFSTLSPALGFLISYIFVILIFLPFVFKLIPRVKLSFSKELTKKLLFYGFPIMLSSVAGIIIGYTDTVLITLFRSLEEVGIYQTAQPTALLLWFFAGAFTTVLFPLVVELKTKKIRGLENGISLIYKYIWIIIIPFALMAFSFSTEILNLFFGSFYTQGSDVLKILAVGAIFFSIVQINGTVLNGLGKPKNYTKIVYLGAIINLAGNLILIPIIGITGAAISTLLTYLIMFFFSFVELRKFIKIKVPVLDWTKTLIIGLVSLLLIYLLKNLLVANIFLEVFICFSVSLSAFIILLVLFRIVDLKEILKLVKQIIKR